MPENTFTLSCDWKYSNKDFSHGKTVQFESTDTNLNLHSRRPNPVLVNKYNDKRLKVWLTSHTRNTVNCKVNGMEISVDRRNNNAATLYERNLTLYEYRHLLKGLSAPDITEQELNELNENDEKKLKQQREADEIKKANRIAANDARFAEDFENMDTSPIEFARERCYHLLEKEGRSREFWFYRGMIIQVDYWRNKVKPSLQAQVEKEMDAAEEWLENWTAFRDWWQSIPTDPKKYDDQFIERYFLRKFNEDIQYMSNQYADVITGGYRGEIEAAASEVGLESWDGSEEWDDGILWLKYPPTDVLFPFNLCWIHNPRQNYNWGINTNFRVNQWLLSQHGPIEEVDQDTAWGLSYNLITIGKTYLNTDFKLTNRLLNYHGGHKGPNVFFKSCMETVRNYANTNPPPKPIPFD